MPATSHTNHTIELLPSLTDDHIEEWLQHIRDDPATIGAYSDYMSMEAGWWHKAIALRDVIAFPWTVDGQLAGIATLHDLVYQDDGTPSHAWLGGYSLNVREWRGKTTKEAMCMVYDAASTRGWFRWFTACRDNNRAAKAWAVKGMGFTRVAVYQDWIWFDGQLDACAIYTKRPQDAVLCWESATDRAAYHRYHPPSQRTSQ